jgi:hypothetical protein
MGRTDLTIKYEDIAASQTAQVLGATGSIGDRLDLIIIIPETTSAGTVALLDGAVSRNIFIAGTLTGLNPIIIPIGARSTNAGGWKITTGAAVHCIAIGEFS